jgi:hypothetical protein
MNKLGDLVALLIVAIIFYLLGILVILIAGLGLRAAFMQHPEDLMMWAILGWSIFCIFGGLRFTARMLRREF